MDIALQQILREHTPEIHFDSPETALERRLGQQLQVWSPRFLRVIRSGSVAKGTAVRGGSDLDLLLSFSSTEEGSLRSLYDDVGRWLESHNFEVRRQRVSLGIEWSGHKVDIVPGRREGQHGNVHHLHNFRTKTWTKTDLNKHASQVRDSGRLDEIRLLKIWRNNLGLDWPSLYLELFVIDALYGARHGWVHTNLLRTWQDLASGGLARRICDPSNPSNVLSTLIDDATKRVIAEEAAMALRVGAERALLG
jgi:predicted nucleotidyltransferase